MTKTYPIGVFLWFSKFGPPAIISLGTFVDGPIGLFGILNLDYWDLFVIWILVLGILCF